MVRFLSSFLAALLALILFSLICIFILVLVTSSKKVVVGSKAVLVLDLGETIPEQYQENPLARIGLDNQNDEPGLYDIVRMIAYAKRDSSVKGIFVKCGANNNGFASSEEIRNALSDFKKSGKFIYAYADVIPQKAYYVACLADRIYCNPKGGVDWRGFASQVTFFKGALQKLDIEPQIFYAGKFKSATEPFREDHMTEASRLQTTILLNNLYNQFLFSVSQARHTDSAGLRKAVNEHLIAFAADALAYHLVDGLKYDDEVKNEIKQIIHIAPTDRINFLSMTSYANAVDFRQSGKKSIALIYAQGDIVDGKGGQDQIGGETFRALIRSARLDKDIKAIVLRINSGGGSSMASENLWRELTMARKDKPVVISFGDVAASGGYYLSCNADSIFSQPGTITGSIGVFSILPNLQPFFKNKLGITFDGVKTAPDADAMMVSRPLSASQKAFMQQGVDSIYLDFKSRVAQGRKLDIQYVDSIAQGRVWVGQMAQGLGLVDRMGGLQDAVECASRLSGTPDYRLKEFPEAKGSLLKMLGAFRNTAMTSSVKEELGEEGYRALYTLHTIKALFGITQTRLPFDIRIQ